MLFRDDPGYCEDCKSMPNTKPAGAVKSRNCVGASCSRFLQKFYSKADRQRGKGQSNGFVFAKDSRLVSLGRREVMKFVGPSWPMMSVAQTRI